MLTMRITVSALKDAVTYNRQLLNSQTLKKRDEYEEHLMILNALFEHIKEEYKRKVESQGGTPLDELL